MHFFGGVSTSFMESIWTETGRFTSNLSSFLLLKSASFFALGTFPPQKITPDSGCDFFRWISKPLRMAAWENCRVFFAVGDAQQQHGSSDPWMPFESHCVL